MCHPCVVNPLVFSEVWELFIDLRLRLATFTNSCMARGTTFTLDNVIVMLGQDKVDRIAQKYKNEIK